MNNKSLKILSVPVDHGGCGWYRVRQPFQAINEYTDSNAHVIDKSDDDPLMIAQALIDADILVVRQGGEAGIEPLKGAADAMAVEMGKKQGFHAKVVFDIDDNIELISAYSEHYGEYGVRDFYDNNIKKWLWKHGETQNFDLVRNRQKVMSFMFGLRKADLVTVTTEYLADYARLFNPNVEVLPNLVNLKRWWKPKFIKNEQLRIGWSGGHSHYEDWYTLKDPINRLLRKYKFKLIFHGTGFSGLIDEDLRHLVEEHQWQPFEAYSYNMMLLNLDIGIIPLADIPFNNYKSAIKWEEFSSMGVPTVISNITPYKEVIEHGKTAMAYNAPSQMYNYLEELINNPNKRAFISTNAQQEVKKIWGLEQNINLYLDAYRSIL